MEALGIIIWLLFGTAGGFIASHKKRSYIFWFILCTILGLVGLAIALLMPKIKKEKTPESTAIDPIESKLKYLQMKSDFEKSKSEKV